MFISTLYFWFGRGNKETGLVLAFVDYVALAILVFVGGRWLSFAGVLLTIGVLIVVMRGARAYFVWREKQRQRLIKTPGWNGTSGFPSWIPLADMWADIFRGAGVFFMLILILGKLSQLLW